MIPPDYDVLIIGGGPGGSTAATFLVLAGKRVVVLEKEHFPRFHIGESLLPYSRQIFDELGVSSALEAAKFPKKLGAQFHLGNGSRTTRFLFSTGRFTRETEAIQVERSVFDLLLLTRARACGADVREGMTVQKYEASPSRISVEAIGSDGTRARLTAKFLIDASGRGNLTGNQDGLRVPHPRLRKLALFAHFHGVQRDAGPAQGDTVIIRLENKWFWLIPISATKTSVGCVLDQSEFSNGKESPDQVFTRLMESSPPLRSRMLHATPTSPVQTTSDFSYHNARLVGPRLLRVGDAAGFMDPIFSAGVHLALSSGKLAAEALRLALDANSDGMRPLAAYEHRVRRSMGLYLHLAEQFYTTAFIELLMSPRERFQLASAVNAILAGELDGSFHVRWRLRLFFWLVRLQRFHPLVPRISFR